MRLPRRSAAALLAAAAVAPLAPSRPRAAADAGEAVLYKSPQCGCCDGHADHLRRNGLRIRVVETHDLPLIKQRHGVPEALEGCHTTLVGGYVVEGHVPAGVLDRLLATLCARLRAAGLGAQRVALSAWRVDGVVQQVVIGTGQPTRAPAHLRRLFAERLEGLEPGLGFERMTLEAPATEPVAAGTQTGLGIGNRHEAAATAEALAQLLDRLAQRLRVHRVAPVASQWPERAVAALDPHATVPAMPAGWATPGLPVLLRRRPEPLEAVALLPDDPPSLLRWRGMAHRLHWAEGPLRLEPEWWRARPDLRRRDYYRVELASGVRLWVCRTDPPEAARWLLHGHLP